MKPLSLAVLWTSTLLAAAAPTWDGPPSQQKAGQFWLIATHNKPTQHEET